MHIFLLLAVSIDFFGTSLHYFPVVWTFNGAHSAIHYFQVDGPFFVLFYVEDFVINPKFDLDLLLFSNLSPLELLTILVSPALRYFAVYVFTTDHSSSFEHFP